MSEKISRKTALLLNGAHALDHMFLLIFATAVVPIAAEFGFAGWEDLMPYSVGAFMLFGLGALPSGRLGDLWGRRRMMLVFFFGMGASALLVALTANAWQLACALTLLGAFSSIYHPVGIPMLVRDARRPGLTIGVNGLAGNLGVALAAVTTGLLVKYAGWRAAFAVPGLVALACGLAFARIAPAESQPPAHGARLPVAHDPRTVARVLVVMTVAAISSSLLFNFTTNGNGQLLRERFEGIVEDPAVLGAMLAGVYVIASFAQVAVGLLIDRYPLKHLYAGIVALQVPLFAAAADALGLGAVRAADPVHGRRVRGDSVHRCDDRPLRRRPRALAGERNPPHRVVRSELGRRLAPRSRRQGERIRRAADGDGRDRLRHACRRRAAAALCGARGIRAGAG